MFNKNRVGGRNRVGCLRDPGALTHLQQVSFLGVYLFIHSVFSFICSFMLPPPPAVSLWGPAVHSSLAFSLPHSTTPPPQSLSRWLTSHLLFFHSHRSVHWQTERWSFYTVKAASQSRWFNKLPHLYQSTKYFCVLVILFISLCNYIFIWLKIQQIGRLKMSVFTLF